jgi:hypothetical protein
LRSAPGIMLWRETMTSRNDEGADSEDELASLCARLTELEDELKAARHQADQLRQVIDLVPDSGLGRARIRSNSSPSDSVDLVIAPIPRHR